MFSLTGKRLSRFLAIFLCATLLVCAFRCAASPKEELSEYGEVAIEQLVAIESEAPLFLLTSLGDPPKFDTKLYVQWEEAEVASIEESVLIPGYGASDLSPPCGRS